MKLKNMPKPKYLLILVLLLLVIASLIFLKVSSKDTILNNRFTDETGYSYGLPDGWSAWSNPRFPNTEGDELKKQYGEIKPSGDFEDQIITGSSPPSSLTSDDFPNSVKLNVKGVDAFYFVSTNSQISQVVAFVNGPTHHLLFSYQSSDLSRQKLEDFPYYKVFLNIVESVRFE